MEGEVAKGNSALVVGGIDAPDAIPFISLNQHVQDDLFHK